MDLLTAYTGAQSRLVGTYESLAAFYADVEQHTQIPAARQLVLVTSGRRARLETLVAGQRLFCYDKSVLTGQLSRPRDDGGTTTPESTLEPFDEHHAAGRAASWAAAARSTTITALNSIRQAKFRTQVILESASLAEKHMQIHLEQARHLRDKRAAAFAQIKHNLDACSSWKDDFKAYKSVLGLGSRLDTLDYDATEAAWDLATKTADSVHKLLENLEDPETKFPDAPKILKSDDEILEVDLNALATQLSSPISESGPSQHELAAEIVAVHQDTIKLAESTTESLKSAQQYLIQVVRQVSRAQTSTATQKQQLASVAEQLRIIDSSKAQVAKVVDFPFIYGVSLIETSRRHAWSAAVEHLKSAAMSHFEQLRASEYERIDRWISHYSSLDLIDRLVSVDVKLPTVEMVFDGIQLENSPDIHSYLASLQQAGFQDIVTDLRSELDAMSQQLERSLRATSKTQVLFPDINASQVIRDEQIRDQARFEARQSDQEARSRLAKDRQELDRERERLRERERELDLRIQQFEKRETAVPVPLGTSPALAAALPASPPGPQDSYILELQEQINRLQNIKPQKWVESLIDKTHDLSQRLYANSHNLEAVLEKMGLQTVRKRQDETLSYGIERVRGISRKSKGVSASVSVLETISASASGVAAGIAGMSLSEVVPPAPRVPDPSLLNWVFSPDNDDEYRLFIQEIYIDYDIFRQVVSDRFSDVEKIARRYHAEYKASRERIRELERSVRYRLALNQFKVGDLILFLPTRDSVRTPNPWAAFNVNSPHYFLDPKDAMKLAGREFLIGRATAIVQHKVESGGENPFSLPEGLTWNMISAEWK